MVPEDVTEEFSRYVMNDIPIRLIHVQTMKFVGRGFVKKHFGNRIAEITESVLAEEHTDEEGWKITDRAQIIKGLIRRKVRYAVLSHRWLDGGEPTYHGMVDMNTTAVSRVYGSQVLENLSRIVGLKSALGDRDAPKPGYTKLMKFCEEAKHCGMEFAWADTCCIDKSSSAELDESIRSMFRWYRNSAVCIAYLSQTLSMDDLQQDEWLRRGWTLQELLAPWKIKFFNEQWEPLSGQPNDKDEDSPIISKICEVTGIPEFIICNFDPAPDHIDEKMTWAAKRKTTRGEDVAYSLMGIFDVSLQIAYGEGADRAFSRLVEAIMQSGGDSSVLNWAGRCADHHSSSALPLSPASYVGHPSIIQIGRLDMALTSRGLRVPLVILPLELASKNFDPSLPLRNPKFRCSHHRIGEVCIDTLNHSFKGFGREFALGITQYIPPEDSANPGLPKELVAYLLQRQEVKGGEKQILGLSKHYRSAHEDGWKRVPTAFITFMLPDVPDFASYLYVSRDCLETVYL